MGGTRQKGLTSAGWESYLTVTSRAWLVDLDGTLYRRRPVQALMLLTLLRSRPRELRAVWAFRRQHERMRRGDLPPGDPFQRQIEQTAERVGMLEGELEPIVWKYMIERPAYWIHRFRRQELLAEISRFRERGGRCALVSDYPARVKLSALGAGDLFEVVVAPGELHSPNRLKPDPEGYLLAADTLGVAPADCLVIGDRTDADGEAARTAGMAFRKI